MPLALALLLLFATAAAMLAVPFLPMWAEWRRPTDDVPLTVRADDSNAIDFFARRVRDGTQARPDEQIVRGDLVTAEGATFAGLLVEGDASIGAGNEIAQWVHADGSLTLGPGTTALRRASAGREMRLASDCTFERLNAPRILFGAAPEQDTPEDSGDLPHIDIATLAGAVKRSSEVSHIHADLVLAPRTRYQGSVVVTGSLSIGAGAVLSGSVKSYRGIVVGPGARVGGALVSNRNIHLLACCRVRGPVVSEADILMSAGSIVGSPEAPTSVTGQNILVEEGAIAHGSVWAHDVGVVWAARQAA